MLWPTQTYVVARNDTHAAIDAAQIALRQNPLCSEHDETIHTRIYTQENNGKPD